MIGRIVCHGGVPGHDHKAARNSSVSALKTPVVMTPCVIDSIHRKEK